MRNVLLTVFGAMCLFSCKGKEEGQLPAPMDNPELETVSDVTCYELVQNKDTVKMQLKTNGINVDGNLEYLLNEKDKNIGKFSGIMKGDTLIADYTFMSEGKNSVREEIFLKRGDFLVKGNGEIVEKGNKQCYADHGAVTFDSGMQLSRVDCK